MKNHQDTYLILDLHKWLEKLITLKQKEQIELLKTNRYFSMKSN